MTGRLTFLYQQYIDNQCSSDELQELKQLLDQPENEQYLIELLDNTWDKVQKLPLDDVAESKADEIYFSITSQPKKRSKPMYPWFSMAAVLLLAAAFGLYCYQLKRGIKPTEISAIKTASIKTEILPGSNKAVLTLDNGQQIILDDAHMGEIARQKNAVIQKTSGGLLYSAVSLSAKNTALKNALNTITIPKGGQYRVTLSDGTLVFLNAASELVYPVKFSGAARSVTLKGEAYFEVAKNPKMPFKVNVAGKQEVEVLGTHFNVAAYADEKTVKTTLLEGSVKISSLQNQAVLKPGQMAINQPDKNLLVKTADVEAVMAWKNGEFMFNNENITSMMQQVARWYNVEVVFKGNLQDINFTGNYSRAKSLSNLLKNIELINKVHFITNGRRVTVMAK